MPADYTNLESSETYLARWLANADATTGAALMMDTIHHEVHEGEMFKAEYTPAAAVANGGTVQFVITTGTKESHFQFGVNAGGACSIYLFEGATATGGTALPIYNFYRDATNTEETTIVHSPTAGTAGTVAIIDGRYLASGTGAAQNARVGGGLQSGVEWILGTAQTYMLNVVNSSGGTVPINTVFEFYEETIV